MKKEIRERILDDQELIGKIAAARGRTVASVVRWCRSGHEYLTLDQVLSIVRNHFGIKENSSLIEKVKK